MDTDKKGTASIVGVPTAAALRALTLTVMARGSAARNFKLLAVQLMADGSSGIEAAETVAVLVKSWRGAMIDEARERIADRHELAAEEARILDAAGYIYSAKGPLTAACGVKFKRDPSTGEYSAESAPAKPHKKPLTADGTDSSPKNAAARDNQLLASEARSEISDLPNFTPSELLAAAAAMFESREAMVKAVQALDARLFAPVKAPAVDEIASPELVALLRESLAA